MFVLDGNKLYIKENDSLIKINIENSNIVPVGKMEGKLSGNEMYLTRIEVFKKFNLRISDYKFPVTKEKTKEKTKEVKSDDGKKSTATPKTTTKSK